MILKNNAHEKVLSVKEVGGGLDFYFKNKSQAMRICDFLQGVVPTKLKTAQQLVSHDEHANIFNYKFTYSLEIPKICREDLVLVSPKISKSFGGVNNVLVCYKVSTLMHLIDPLTMKSVDINSKFFFQNESDFHVFSFKGHATEFLILSVERGDPKKNINLSFNGLKYTPAEVSLKVLGS
jgi:nonsense-mediated mRNA decay protein 3